MGPGVVADDLKMLKDLAYINGLRGRDGSGIIQGFGSKWRKEYKVCKTWQEISYLLWFNEYSSKGDRKFLSDIQCNFFAVHSRWATMGVNSDDNSHPFDFDNLTGMHNGTLENLKYYDMHKTDSELMFEEMNRRGVDVVLKEIVEHDPKDAYAIVVYDKKTGELVFARNEHRPLFFAYNMERSVVYWASEENFLRTAAERNKVKISSLVFLKPNYVYRVDPSQVKKGEWPEWSATNLFPKGVPTKIKAGPPTKKDSVEPSVQEKIELQRAIEKGKELVATAINARSSTSLTSRVPRILDSSIESSRLWDDVSEHPWYDDGSAFDKVKKEDEVVTVLTGVPKGPEDFRFNPTRLLKEKCSFCGEELNLIDQFYATHHPKNVISCKECTDLAGMEATEHTSH